MGIAESWAGLDSYKINGYTSYFKRRCNTLKYSRNPGGLAVYIKDDISKRAKEIAAGMKEIVWIGIREENSSHLEIFVGFIYNASLNSRWYNPNFTKELEKKLMD
jgi:hypothetical protein